MPSVNAFAHELKKLYRNSRVLSTYRKIGFHAILCGTFGKITQNRVKKQALSKEHTRKGLVPRGSVKSKNSMGSILSFYDLKRVI